MVVCLATFIVVVLVASISTTLTIVIALTRKAIISLTLKAFVASYLKVFVVAALVFFTAVALAIRAIVVLGGSGCSALHNISDNSIYLIVTILCLWGCAALRPPWECIGEGGILEDVQWLGFSRRPPIHTSCSGLPALLPACSAYFLISL
jgi:hypothetical protein